MNLDLARLDAHTALRERLTETATTRSRALVGGFNGWYDHAAITTMTGQVVAVVEPAQRGIAQLTDAHLTTAITTQSGEVIDPAGIIDPATLREGVTHAGAYGRLADQYRYEASRGTAYDTIMTALMIRLTAMIATDMQLALTRQVRRTLAASKTVTGYRRIIRPEMSKGRVCGLCLAASDRVYHRGDLLPLHDGCHCAVLPITARSDPGRLLNRDELDQLYADAGSNTADALVQTRYVVRDHGELGPVLVHAAHRFRGPADLP